MSQPAYSRATRLDRVERLCYRLGLGDVLRGNGCVHITIPEKQRSWTIKCWGRTTMKVQAFLHGEDEQLDSEYVASDARVEVAIARIASVNETASPPNARGRGQREV